MGTSQDLRLELGPLSCSIRPAGLPIPETFVHEAQSFDRPVDLSIHVTHDPAFRGAPLFEPMRVNSDGQSVTIVAPAFHATHNLANSKLAIQISAWEHLKLTLRFFAALTLARRGYLLVHSAGLLRNGRAYLFIGPSGAGKTTLSELSDATGHEVLGTDATIVGFRGGHPIAWGTFFSSEPDRSSPRGAELAGCYFIKQAARAHLVALPAHASVSQLQRNTLLMLDGLGRDLAAEIGGVVLDTCMRISRHVACGELSFNRSPSFWRLVDNG